MAYPVYQRREQVQYPDPKNMVVNWSRAADKITEGITEGISLGMKIKESKEKSAMNLANLKSLDVATRTKQFELQTAEMRRAALLRMDALTEKNLDAQNQINYSASAISAAQAKSAMQAKMNAQDLQALEINTQYLDPIEDIINNASVMEARIAQVGDPSVAYQYLNDAKKEVDELRGKIGINISTFAQRLKRGKNDARADQISKLDPIVLEERFLGKVMVPIYTNELKKYDYGLYAGGDIGDIEKPTAITTTSVTMVPWTVAKNYWRGKMSTETFESVRESASNPEKFDKLAREQGLGHLLPKVVTPAVGVDGVPLDLKFMKPAGENETISEQARRELVLAGEKSPLNVATGSITQKLSEKLTTHEFSVVSGLINPGTGLLSYSPAIARETGSIVKWLAEKTGIGIEASYKLHDKIKNILPRAGEATKAFRGNPANVEAENKFWEGRRNDLYAELPTASPARKAVINEAIGLINQQHLKPQTEFPDEASARAYGWKTGDTITINGRPGTLD